ncbi:TRAP transporter small permease [Anaerotruncus colihominis]|uniref:TRAP transporter small permease n=1 Tax=Anaerotruncus colihominis TaxID=169435 RepID=UPI00111DBFCF|nr:TRAP transporter small permease [Anaerotruncus colihominis]
MGFQYFSKFLDRIEKLLAMICAFLLSSSFLIILWQVIARYVLKTGGPWMEEYARWAAIWMSFLGSAIAVRRSQHMQIDILQQYLKKWPTMLVCVTLLFHIVETVFFIVLIKLGIDYVISTNGSFSTALNLPKSCLYASVPVGMVFMILYTIEIMGKSILIRNDTLAKKEKSEWREDAQ